MYNPQWNNGTASTKIERSIKEGISLQEKTNLETWKQFEYDCIEYEYYHRKKIERYYEEEIGTDFLSILVITNEIKTEKISLIGKSYRLLITN